MAKKSGNNAVKKIDDQIKILESNSKDSLTVKKTSTTKKTTSSKKTTATKSTRDKVVVAPAKKKKTTTTTAKKTTTSKNVRGGVVAPAKKKKTTTKTITNEKIKNELKSKKEKIEVVPSARKKKELETEVNKILEIEDTYEIDSIELPKFVQEDKPEVEELKEDLETKVKEFLIEEEQKEVETPVETSIDDVNVIKFSDKADLPPKSHLLEKEKEEDLSLEKPIDIDDIDKIEEFNIVEDFEKDIPKSKPVPKKQEFTRKRKGKGYIVSPAKKPTYRELESDLRSLYDKVDDVVGDFDETAKPVVEEPKKEKKTFTWFTSPKKTTKPVSTVPVKKKTMVPTYPKKKKVVREEPIVLGEGERPSLLDHISQRVLNGFLIVLFTIFFLMCIAFVGFVIYVSTF